MSTLPKHAYSASDIKYKNLMEMHHGCPDNIVYNVRFNHWLRLSLLRLFQFDRLLMPQLLYHIIEVYLCVAVDLFMFPLNSWNI